MSYNRGYGQRAPPAGRYNTPGHFVSASAGELNNASMTPTRATRSTVAATAANTNPYASPYAAGGQTRQPLAAQQQVGSIPQPPPPPQQQQYQQNQQVQQQSYQAQQPEVTTPKVEDMETDGADTTAAGPRKPAWMKGKGVRKVSNKERRRRQNEHLRRLLTPKNALMVLNEMMPGEQITNSFTVEAAPANSPFFQRQSGQNFCAGLALEGSVYKGFGENKLTARNAAAEQAIRDLVIKRMTKVLARADSSANLASGSNGEGAANGAAAGEPAEGGAAATEEEDTLPMIQLASYALHKLFSEWQYEGYQVPLLNRQANPSVGQESSEQLMPAARAGPGAAVATAAKPKKQKEAKELPATAAEMHPSVLLTYMRPGHEYHELGAEGDKPQNTVFTMAVTVDGATYVGKGSSKKIAKRLAARSACAALFNIHYAEQ